MSKRYLVTLTEDDRAALGQRVSAGRGPARELGHARILLKADEGPHGPAWTDEQIATALDASLSTISRVRERFVEQGLDSALRRQPPRREYRCRLDGEQEAHLVALACTPPPLGRRRWTRRPLADTLVELRRGVRRRRPAHSLRPASQSSAAWRWVHHQTPSRLLMSRMSRSSIAIRERRPMICGCIVSR
jgi:hypothetical protein